MKHSHWWKALLGFAFLLPLSLGGCQMSCDSDDDPIEEAADELEDAVD